MFIYVKPDEDQYEKLEEFINLERKKNNNLRYKVIEGSLSSHCCFEASIIDLESYDINYESHKEKIGRKIFVIEYIVCEFFELENAYEFCKIINEDDKK